MGIALPQLAPASEDRVSGAQVIDGSLKFNDDSSNVLKRTPGSAGNRRTWTWSSWVVRTTLGTEGGIFSTYAGAHPNTSLFWESEGLKFHDYTGSYNIRLGTAAVFRDTSAWYHIVLTYDSTESTASDRAKLYVNGTLQTLSGTTVPSNFQTDWNSTTEHNIGAFAAYFDGSMSQCYFIDGQALGPESFGYTDGLTNTWRPKKYTGEFNFTVGTTNYTSISTLAALAGSTLNSSYNDVSKVFDGSGTGVRTVEETSNQGEKLSITFSPAITLSNQTVSIDTYSTYQGMFVTVGGADGSRVSGSDSNTTTLTTGSLSGSLSKITVDNGTDTSGRGASILRIRIGGSTLLNPVIGVNGFYLPMDGNSPIGEDKSGKGNNWTPVNFGGSVALDNPQVSGARPILNTDGGGNVARPGVFGSEVGFRDTVSSSSGGGNPYIFDTNGTQPTFNFIRGATYVFDYSSATSHPLRFATAADAAGSTEYTDGTSVSGNVISFTVPHNAPNTLYYYCTNHSGMGNSISVTTDETKADPYAWKNFLALPLVGSDNDVSNSANSGSTAKVATNSSVDASSTQSNFYGGSHYWNANTDSLLYAQQGNDLVFGTGDFTIEFWFYDDNGHNGTGNRCVLFDNRRGGNVQGDPPQLVGWVDSHNEINLYYANGSEIKITVGTTVGKWWHYAAVRSGGTTKLYVDGVEVGSASDTTNYPNNGIALGSGTDSGYSWSGYIQDFRIYNGVAKYTSNFVVPATSPDVLPDTPSGVSGSSKLTKITDGAVTFDGGDSTNLAVPDSSDFDHASSFTWEGYFYLIAYDSSASAIIRHENDGLDWYINTSGNIVFNRNTSTTLVQSGNGAFALNKWVHIAVSHTGSVCKMFVDGIEKASATTTDVPDNVSGILYIGETGDNNNYQWNGFISNLRFVNGTALYTTDFTPPTAPLTNVTNTKLLCCQSNTSATTAAVIPTGSITANGNAAATTFNPFNTDINTVRGQESGYATWNPLSLKLNQGTLSDGNLTLSATGSYYIEAKSTFDASMVDNYSELSISSASGSDSFAFGIAASGDAWIISGVGTYLVYRENGAIIRYPGNTTVATVSSYTVGDVLGMAIDSTNVKFYKNNILQGTYAHGYSKDYFVTALNVPNSGTSTMTANFGQKPFRYSPPAGFQPLNAANVRPETVIARPDQFVSATLYSGNNGTQNINAGLKPDFVWIKNRSSSATDGNHLLFDTIRGVQNAIYSNLVDDQDTLTNSLTSFNLDGFTVGGPGASGNIDSQNYVAWTWKAGGNKNTFNVDDIGYASAAAAGLTGGSITPTGSSVGTRQGFSIIKYTGNGNAATIPHGLSQTPTFLIKKFISASSNWDIWTPNIGANKRLTFTNAATDSTTSYQNVNSTTFDVHAGGNDNTVTMIAYLWHDVPGLQKFGSYTGGGSSYPFIELGFSPAILMIKNASTGGTHYDWKIIDSTRNPFNLGADNADSKNVLFPNLGDAENKGGVPWAQCDFLSNGFRMNDQSVSVNNSGSTYVYAAWAEAPTFNLFGGQSNAF